MKKQFKVPGITCSHCVNKLQKFIDEVPGAKFISADIQSKSIEVEFQATDEQKIIEAILDAGFEVE